MGLYCISQSEERLLAHDEPNSMIDVAITILRSMTTSLQNDIDMKMIVMAIRSQDMRDRAIIKKYLLYPTRLPEQFNQLCCGFAIILIIKACHRQTISILRNGLISTLSPLRWLWCPLYLTPSAKLILSTPNLQSSIPDQRFSILKSSDMSLGCAYC